MGPEMIFIILLALVLFGPKKLPELSRTVGRALVIVSRHRRQPGQHQAGRSRAAAQLRGHNRHPHCGVAQGDLEPRR